MNQETNTEPAQMKEAQHYQNRRTAILAARESLYCSYPGFGCFYVNVTRVFEWEQ